MNSSDLALPSGINWKEFACGWGAAFINVTVTYPINKLIFRQMLHGVKVGQAFSQLRSEGLFYLYRGMLPPLCQKTCSLSIMFGVYEEVRRPLLEIGFNEYTAKALGALVSGTTEAILMPFERIQTLLADAKYHKDLKNTLHAFQVVRSYGFGEYYRGLTPILLRNGPSNVGFFIVRDEVQRRMPRYENEFVRSLTEFMCGAMIGVVLSSICYPLNVLKIAMQSKVGGAYENPFVVLLRIYRERGGKIRYIYHGVQTNCTRAFLSWGVMNTAYEHLKEVVYA
ncbi:mitochondrial nicotinamide adenine dinucleotide transporter SLC25A51 [Leptinotarsa decemlineata]|uniref:mitochondrial nicotinamide adenine dinucleotide transporter SLC25A51 n=1 Tax=Leptinotarsa decemlineata TaxID=7539 RepID=UPI000C25291B|nr:solute carrier family 25 member 51 [Leptinotarsa decemlineata]